MVAINLNPYQGLKRRLLQYRQQNASVAINLNPYQGLKHRQPSNNKEKHSCNQPKSLSGIETSSSAEIASSSSSCNQPKSLSGIETAVGRRVH